MKVIPLVALKLGVICAVGACAPQMAMTDSTDPTPEWQTEVRPTPTEEPRIVPIPAIPVALRGCWDAIPPDDPEEPGAPHRMIVTDRTIELTYENSREYASTEYVTRVTPTLIEGMLSYQDDHGRATLATSLGLLDGSPATLRRAEGDAGSVHYWRCPERE